MEVPCKDDSMPKKKPVYGDKRKKKPAVQTPEGTRSDDTCRLSCVCAYVYKYINLPHRNLRGDLADPGDARARRRGDAGRGDAGRGDG